VARALLFDRDEVESVDDWERVVGKLGRSSILWIDTGRPSEQEAREYAEALGLSPESAERVASSESGPGLADHGSYLHLTARAPRSADEPADLVEIECLVSERWILTVHEQPVTVLEELQERAAGTGDVGRLDGPELLANVVEWLLTAYLDAFERIEAALGEFDTRAMAGELGDTDLELRKLVELRRRVRVLREALISHRGMVLALTRPELGAVGDSSSAERFADLRRRLEEVVQAARDTRDSIVGSFQVLVTLTEHKTNEIVKVLTLASVLLLPGALIAGVMGMNFKVGLFDEARNFWLVLGAIVVVALATLGVARARSWI
jgi:magnesium transporter